MTGWVVAMAAGGGTYLLYTALVMGWRGFPAWSSVAAPGGRLGHRAVRGWAARAGLTGAARAEVGGTALAAGFVGGLAGMALFGALLPAALLGLALGAGWPAAAWRVRRERLRAAVQEAWPPLIEDMRILIANLGRSVPQALFEAGRRAPAELRPAFEAAHREWLLSFDFERTTEVLKARLADPTADAACETLLVAHQVGGSDLDRRLEALAADRSLDVQERKDAVARQAGVRFARRFVLLVPGGMALVGTAIGDGRDAYRTAWGQTMVMIGLVAIAGCWVWAGQLLKLPDEERVWR